MPKVIGTHGYPNSGKDTVVNHLVEKHGYTRIAFADPMKEQLYKCNPIVRVSEEQWSELGLEDFGLQKGFIGYDPLEDLNFVFLQGVVDTIGWEAAKEIEDVRVGLQNLGTTTREVHGDDIWLKHIKRRMEGVDKVAISDVRFENEAALIKNEYDGFVVKVVRPGKGRVNDHVSENELPSELVEYVLSNDSTVEALHAQVDKYAN